MELSKAEIEALIKEQEREIEGRTPTINTTPKVKKQTTQRNFYYSKEAVSLVHSLCQYLNTNKNALLIDLINDREIVRPLGKDTDNNLPLLPKIQRNLQSNLTQFKVINEYMESRFGMFKSFNKEDIKIGNIIYKPYEAIDLFLTKTKPIIDIFLLITYSTYEDKSDFYLDLKRQLIEVDYQDSSIENRANIDNRIIARLDKKTLSNLNRKSKRIFDKKQLSNKNKSIRKVKNDTAAMWRLIKAITVKTIAMPITGQDFKLLSDLSKEFNESIHNANSNILLGTDFNATDIYNSALKLYKQIKIITDKLKEYK